MEGLSTVVLHQGRGTDVLLMDELKGYIQKNFRDVEVLIKEDFLLEYLDDEAIPTAAEEMAKFKVRDINKVDRDHKVMYGEVAFEKRILTGKIPPSGGMLYDGIGLLLLMNRAVPEDRMRSDTAHIVFTKRLIGTFDPDDLRYHARVILCGFPSIISTTGLVEAPAKPKEFYRLKQNLRLTSPNVPVEAIEEKFKGRFIDYDDARTTEALKGYVLMALLHHLGLDPICQKPECRLFNAHWQEDLIRAQLEEPEFCSEHKTLMEGFA